MSLVSASLPQSLSERVNDASAVLVLAPSLKLRDDEACFDLLTVREPAHQHVLSVTVTQSAEERVQFWDIHADERPARADIIRADEFTRSASAEIMSSQHSTAPLQIETISDPADLTDLGTTISTFLSEWADLEQQIVVCFHLLTPLLQHVDLQRVFRFSHVLIGRFRTLDAVAHFHFDPSVHDTQTVQTLIQLVDAVVELDADSEWRVRQ